METVYTSATFPCIQSIQDPLSLVVHVQITRCRAERPIARINFFYTFWLSFCHIFSSLSTYTHTLSLYSFVLPLSRSLSLSFGLSACPSPSTSLSARVSNDLSLSLSICTSLSVSLSLSAPLRLCPSPRYYFHTISIPGVPCLPLHV